MCHQWVNPTKHPNPPTLAGFSFPEPEPMRLYLAEAIRINGLPAAQRRAEIDHLPLGSRTVVAVLAKHLARGG